MLTEQHNTIPAIIWFCKNNVKFYMFVFYFSFVSVAEHELLKVLKLEVIFNECKRIFKFEESESFESAFDALLRFKIVALV